MRTLLALTLLLPLLAFGQAEPVLPTTDWSASWLENAIDAATGRTLLDAQSSLPSGSNGEWLTLSGGVPDWAALPSSTNLPNLTVTNGAAFLANASVTSNLTVGSAGQLLLPNGSLENPSVAFTGDKNTGLRWGTLDGVLDLVCNGNPLVTLGYGGVFSMGSTPITFNGGGLGTRPYLVGDPGAVIAQRNGTTAQTNRLFRTWTDTSNGAWLESGFDGADAYIAAKGNGTGGADQTLKLKPQGSGVVDVDGSLNVDTNVTVGGQLLFSADNSKDIGSSGANRPRNIYVGSGIAAGGGVTANTGFRSQNGGGGTPTEQLIMAHTSGNYAHQIKTSHSSGDKSNNYLDINIWNYGVDAPSTAGTLNAVRIDGNGSVSVASNITANGYFAKGSNVGLSVTNDVLVAGGTTNRMVFAGGILISNIANFYP